MEAVASLTVLRDGDFESVGLLSHEAPGLLVFVESERHLPSVLQNAALRCIITTSDLAAQCPERVAVAIAASPRKAFYEVHSHLAGTDFYWKTFPTQIDPTARIHPRAYVAESDVRIGPGCVVEPNASILERSVLEESVVVRAGAVIGGEGFQYPVVDGSIVQVVHAGGVCLERGVEVQHNSCVDRAVFGGFTLVGEGTKIDNLVHIAHNVALGKRNRVAALAMVAGSVRTGDDVWIGPSCAVSSGLTVGARAHVTLGAVVTRDVPEGARVSGNFAIEHARFITHMKSIR